jgi:xylulose-5-phosphate/fructose-6-phosphate phosphoketolase
VTDDELRGLDAYWRAANYLSVGQIYLLDNPLLRGPLRPEHVKPRLLGHWGTTPGLNFLYTHLDRAIRERHLDAIFVCGPGHGGPAVVAYAYLEGTYSELYPPSFRTRPGYASCSGSSRSRAASRATRAPETPGSIHEGGELGYALGKKWRTHASAPEPTDENTARTTRTSWVGAGNRRRPRLPSPCGVTASRTRTARVGGEL